MGLYDDWADTHLATISTRVRTEIKKKYYKILRKRGTCAYKELQKVIRETVGPAWFDRLQRQYNPVDTRKIPQRGRPHRAKKYPKKTRKKP